jgi:O-antigen ligase
MRTEGKWHGGSGSVSIVVLTLLPCALMAAWYGHRRDLKVLRGWSLAFATLLLVTAYATLNRTIWFAIVLEALVIGSLLALRERTSIGVRTKAVAAAGAVLLLAGAALMSSHIQAEREQNGAPIVLSEDPRLKLWPEVLEHFKERPLTGYGFGRGVLRQPLHNAFRDPLLWHAHNLFLDPLLQVGVPGLILLLVLLGATLREGWRLASMPEEFTAACGIAVIALVVGMLIRNMTDTLWVRHSALAYWAVLGVLLAWGHRARPAG